LASLLVVLSTVLGVRHRADVMAWLRPHTAPVPANRAGGGAQTAAAAAPASQDALRVLFIGNSLTATHDIPGMVQRLARAAKQPRAFEYRADTPGGFGLLEHAQSGRLQQNLQRAHWDTVVLQDQGQRPAIPESREKWLREPARALDRAIRAAGSKTLFYLTFARRTGDSDLLQHDDYDAMQGRLAEGYSDIARELNAALVPIGTIWQLVHREHPELQLWEPDGLHPSVAGSYLAACAFYAYFYRESPLDNPYVAGLDADDARLVQSSTAAVMLGWRLAVEQPSPAPTNTDTADALEPNPPQPSRADADETAQDRARHARIEADRTQRALRAARDRVPIKLYSATWCGYCKKASAYMRQAGIAFDEYDIDHDSGAKEAVQRLNPRGSVPTIDVAGEVLVGWNPTRFEDTVARAARTRARL
jgi:glutaredoxin